MASKLVETVKKNKSRSVRERIKYGGVRGETKASYQNHI